MCVAPVQESEGVIPLNINKQINVFCSVGEGKTTVDGDNICNEDIRIRIPPSQNLVHGDTVDVKITITFADNRPPIVFDDLDFTLNEEDIDVYENFDFESFEFIEDNGQHGGYFKALDNAFSFEDVEGLLLSNIS